MVPNIVGTANIKQINQTIWEFIYTYYILGM